MATITTNNVPRFTIDSWELTASERDEFDYLNWEAIEKGEDSATFFRFKGRLYDINEFSASWGISKQSGLPEWLNDWDGYTSDSFFSGMVLKYNDLDETVIVGTYYI